MSPHAPPPTTCRVNGGDPARVLELHVDVERIEVTAYSATEPDPSWTHTDPAGHWHARARGENAYPTLLATREHVECTIADCRENGECDGYDVQAFACLACGARVTPGRRPLSSDRRFIPGPETWTLTVELPVVDDPLAGGLVSVVIDDGRLFGFAIPVEHQYAAGELPRTTLRGASPLGRRP